MDKEKVEVGDYVVVYFSNTQLTIHSAEVLHVPQATGDSWILKSHNKKIVYVQLFERMDLIRKLFKREQS